MKQPPQKSHNAKPKFSWALIYTNPGKWLTKYHKIPVSTAKTKFTTGSLKQKLEQMQMKTQVFLQKCPENGFIAFL